MRIELSFALLPDQFSHCIQVLSECGATTLSDFISCVRLPVDKRFCHNEVPFTFKCLDVCCQVAVSNAKEFPQPVEIKGIIGHQHRGDLEPDAVLQCLVKILERVLHHS